VRRKPYHSGIRHVEKWKRTTRQFAQPVAISAGELIRTRAFWLNLEVAKTGATNRSKVASSSRVYFSSFPLFHFQLTSSLFHVFHFGLALFGLASLTRIKKLTFCAAFGSFLTPARHVAGRPRISRAAIFGY
jgi:hypothetical protein